MEKKQAKPVQNQLKAIEIHLEPDQRHLQSGSKALCVE